MSQIIAAQIATSDEEGDVYVLDTMGRLWVGWHVLGKNWDWYRVELPEDTQ